MPVLHEQEGLTIEAAAGTRVLRHDGRVVGIIAGEPLGWRTRHGEMSQIASTGQLASLVADAPIEQCAGALEGRFVIAKISDAGWELCADRFGQADVYYQQVDGELEMATSLDLLSMAERPAFDDAALAHALTVYGYRPPKAHTFYRAVRRLHIGQVIEGTPEGFSFRRTTPRIPEARSFGQRELREYADLFLEAVDLRASDEGNVVYLSSGWDSTAILGALVHLRGARNVRAVIGRMNYATRSGVINQFEIDRARAVADYYGVPLEIVELDYWRQGQDLIEEVRPASRAHMLASMTYFNHTLLARHVAATARGRESVFAGEISDGAHNLGFSQFVTIFHPVLEFREYSDKMASYLFGPTFLQQLQQGTFRDDPVYDLMRRRIGAASIDDPASTAEGVTRQLLASFFLRSSRFPMWSLNNTRMLTKVGRERYTAEMESEYLGCASDVTPATLFGWYLHLYNSFHWQGGTVATLSLTADRYGLRMQLPFWDSRLQEFLGAMPEAWGRGLDLKPTKYPLKWMLENVIDYPTHLQVGPHSYLYDVDPSFSHSAEFLYGSGLRGGLQAGVRTRAYRDVLSSEVFDLEHVDALVDSYVAGREVKGADLHDLTAVVLSSASGWLGA